MALFYYSTNGFEWVECSANILNSECDEFRYLSALDECVWFGNRCAGNDMYSIIFGKFHLFYLCDLFIFFLR